MFLVLLALLTSFSGMMFLEGLFKFNLSLADGVVIIDVASKVCGVGVKHPVSVGGFIP